MKAIEIRLTKDIDKSFVFFKETGQYFPCPWHYHPEYELVLVNKSTGRRMVGDHIGYFEDADLVFIGPNLPHVWVNDEIYMTGEAKEKAEAIVIHFHENFLGERFFQIPEMDEFKNLLNLSQRGMVIKGAAKLKVGKLMNNMTSMNGIERLSALFSIFETLSSCQEYELLASPGFSLNEVTSIAGPFDKINEYIMRNFDRDISLQEIAKVANMAITTFCNFFKTHYRVTFIEYLNGVRIGLACKLLADKRKNIVEIAYEVGFNNLGNFNRQFKKIKHLTPREYRKKMNIGLTDEPILENESYVLNS